MGDLVTSSDGRSGIAFEQLADMLDEVFGQLVVLGQAFANCGAFIRPSSVAPRRESPWRILSDLRVT